MLQTHGGEIRWRNLFVHDIGEGEARQILDGAEAESKARLARALTLHASFDEGLDADFARGDKTCYVQQGKKLVTAAPTDEVRLAPDAGRFGGALHFTKKNDVSPGLQGRGRARLQRQELERDGLRLAASRPRQGPRARLLRPGADRRRRRQEGLHLPGMVEGRDAAVSSATPSARSSTSGTRTTSSGPRSRSTSGRWCKSSRAPFSRDAWTHVVFTLENVNDKTKPQPRPALPERQAAGHDREMGPHASTGTQPRCCWCWARPMWAHMDDLAVFNRALTAGEVHWLYVRKLGVSELRH